MFDTSMYNQGRGLQSGLRAGAAINGMIKDTMSTNAVQDAAKRIQSGEDQQAVISQLMAQSPQAAQQLMDLLGGQQNVDAGTQEIISLKQRVGDQVMQSAAMPMFLAMQTDDPDLRNQFISKTADVFKDRDPETAAMIEQLKGLDGRQQFDAIAGTVKAMQRAGVFPDDPSQMQQAMPADVAKFQHWQQMNPDATPEEAREVYNQMSVPFYRSQASAQGAAGVKIDTENKLNPVLAQREVDKTQAIEGTATGGAQLAQEQQAVAKGERELSEAKRAKENAAAAINSQLQQIQRLESHPGFESAVGMSSIAPSMRGSNAYGFEKQLEKLDAQSFMAMIPNLAGMGALSNAEGQKVSAALSALNTGLSEEEFRKEMKVISETLLQARDRLKTGNLVAPEQQSSPAASSVGRFKIEVE